MQNYAGNGVVESVEGSIEVSGGGKDTSGWKDEGIGKEEEAWQRRIIYAGKA